MLARQTDIFFVEKRDKNSLSFKTIFMFFLIFERNTQWAKLWGKMGKKQYTYTTLRNNFNLKRWNVISIIWIQLEKHEIWFVSKNPAILFTLFCIWAQSKIFAYGLNQRYTIKNYLYGTFILIIFRFAVFSS